MPNNNEENNTLNNTAEIRTENSSSEDSLKQKIESLGKEIKSLRKQNQLNSGIIGLGIIGLVGYVVAINWSTIAPALATAGTAIAAASPVIGIVVGAIIGAAVLVGASYAAYKYRAQIKEGFKYAAEKTVEGAEYTARKIKAGYEHSVDSLKRGAHFVNERTKEKVSNMAYSAADALYRASGKEDYLDKITRFTPEEIKKSDEIKSDMKEIFADKGNNAELVKSILSGISSKIDLKIAEEAKSGWIEHTPKWQVQKEFINNLSEKSLRSLLTQRSLPKGSYFIDSVFSEHHSEIKEVIKEYKKNHLYSSVSNMFNTAEKKANRPSLKGLIRSLPSFPSLERKSPKQPDNSSSPVNSTDDSSAPKKVVPLKASDDRSSRNKVIIGEYLEEEEKKQQSPVTSSTATVNPNLLRRNSSSGSLYDGPPVLTRVNPPKAPESPASSRDSGVTLSGPSTPTLRQSPSLKEEFDAELAKRLEKLSTSSNKPVKQQPPSTQMNVVDPQSTLVKGV